MIRPLIIFVSPARARSLSKPRIVRLYVHDAVKQGVLGGGDEGGEGLPPRLDPKPEAVNRVDAGEGAPLGVDLLLVAHRVVLHCEAARRLGQVDLHLPPLQRTAAETVWIRVAPHSGGDGAAAGRGL